MEQDQKNAESSEQNQAEKFLDYENFSQFYDQFSNTIKETVSSSTKIPLKQNDLDYYLTSPTFKTFIQTQNDRILKMMASLLKQQNIKKNNIYSNKLDDEERMDLLIDSNDQIIEKLGIQLDEIQGLRKKTETELKFTATSLNLTSRNINTSWNKDMGMVINKTLLQNVMSTNKHSNGQNGVSMDKNKGVFEKPQILFSDKPDNSHLPFVPKIRHKPNSLQPLAEIFTQLDQEINKELFENNLELLENPYLYEIEQVELTELDTSVKQPLETPKSLEETPFKYIDTVEDLIWLCEHLGKNNRSKIREIAVDLEHHSYRSFLGFTCLMQLSTRSEDFIIDTIKLRSELHRLNEIFTDWTLVKVMHGSDFDIEWLQKDFGLYIVNLFDTGQATRILQFPHFSLSYLLQKYCNVNAQKQYQLADWRQRPLSEGMMKYAREDTHYLIYIYDNLRQELIKKDIQENDLTQLKLVYEKSKQICKKVFKKQIFFTKGFLTLCQNNSHLNSKQMKALRDLYEWRDKMARESDESCEYVLKNHQLLKIAELLPREIYGILALCNPLSSLVQANVHEMNEIIKNAREFKGTFTSNDIENERNNHSFNVSFNNSVPTKTESVLESIVHLTTYDPNNIINNPHDLAHTQNDQNGAEESMNIDSNNQESELKLNLKDLLIKPSLFLPTKEQLPTDLIQIKNSKLSDLFTKDSTLQVESKARDLQEKINKIKEKVENPFSMFLPPDLRLNTTETNYIWNLVKPVDINQSFNSIDSSKVAKPEESPKLDQDILMIPLKRQFHLEKKTTETKKFKNKFKNLEYSEAIIAFNKAQEEREAGLRASSDEEGTEYDIQQQQLNTLIEEKIRSNLKMLSASATSETTANASNTSTPFEYNIDKINKLFSKADDSKNEFDPTGKMRKGNFNRVNKRRTTNAVTRSNNSKSVTFKMNAPSSSSTK